MADFFEILKSILLKSKRRKYKFFDITWQEDNMDIINYNIFIHSRTIYWVPAMCGKTAFQFNLHMKLCHIIMSKHSENNKGNFLKSKKNFRCSLPVLFWFHLYHSIYPTEFIILYISVFPTSTWSVFKITGWRNEWTLI